MVLTDATRMLSEARSLEDLRQIRDIAEAARAYAEAHDLGKEAEQYAGEIRARAERRIGEMLKESPKHPGRPPRRGDSRSAPRSHRGADEPPTLADLGIKEYQSQTWQTVAAMPEAEFEERLIEAKANGRVPSAEVIYREKLREGAPGDHAGLARIDAGPTWKALETILRTLEGFAENYTVDDAANDVPSRRAAGTARRLRRLGTYLGQVAWRLEGRE
jgi:hypothetical protein